MPQRGLGLPRGGPAQRVGGDERVAVAVTADPRAGQQHGPAQQTRVGPALVEGPAQLGVESGHDVEQRQLVVAQRLVDLVLQPQPGQPQQRRLPEREDRAPQLPRPLVDVGLAEGGPVAGADEVGDVPLHLRDRLPAHLGRVGGDHRAHQGAGQLPGHDVVGQVGLVEQRERGRQAALLRRGALPPVEAPAPLVVDVLGQVGQQREVAERADDVVRRLDVEARQPLGELGPVDLGAADLERFDAGGLDQLEDVLAGLLPDHLAQDAPEQADVVAERGVVGTVTRPGRPGVVAEVGDVDGGFGHAPSIRPACVRLMSSATICTVVAIRALMATTGTDLAAFSRVVRAPAGSAPPAGRRPPHRGGTARPRRRCHRGRPAAPPGCGGSTCRRR